MKALVTGATGFVGRRLCATLKQRGDDVVALSRDGGELPDGSATRAVDLAGEIPDDLFHGVQVVYHLAGIAHQKADPGEHERVNNGATVKIAVKASHAGVGKLVFLSSVKAMGVSTTAEPRTEDDCALPADAYGLSKWRAECALREQFGQGSMGVTILRPTLVYGPGVKGNVRQLAKAVGLGLPRPPRAGARSVIALDDLCELMIAAASSSEKGVQTLIASGSDYDLQQIYDQLRSALDLGQNSSWTPSWSWRAASALLDIFSGNSIGSSYDKLFSSDLYSNSRARLALDWKPESTLEEICQQLVEIPQA